MEETSPKATVTRSGFVNIIGSPNAGKSTLMNALLGERMSIITPKPQTTRHRIIGLITEENYQVVLSDTPGFIQEPNYALHKLMNKSVYGSFDDGDLLLFVVDPAECLTDHKVNETFLHPLAEILAKHTIPFWCIINKCDQYSAELIDAIETLLRSALPMDKCYRISAQNIEQTTALRKDIIEFLPPGPLYFPPDQISDRPERFFTTEIIREKIFEQYAQEIPYHTEVGIDIFEEKERQGKPFASIRAIIFVTRQSQKGIILGAQGTAIKKLGIASRKAIEAFLGYPIYLELHVKVRDNWRNDDQQLQSWGY